MSDSLTVLLAAEVERVLDIATARCLRHGVAPLFDWGFALRSMEYEGMPALAAATLGGETVGLTEPLVAALIGTGCSLAGRAPVVFSVPGVAADPWPDPDPTGRPLTVVHASVLVGPRLLSTRGAYVWDRLEAGMCLSGWVVLGDARPPAWPR